MPGSQSVKHEYLERMHVGPPPALNMQGIPGLPTIGHSNSFNHSHSVPIPPPSVMHGGYQGRPHPNGAYSEGPPMAGPAMGLRSGSFGGNMMHGELAQLHPGGDNSQSSSGENDDNDLEQGDEQQTQQQAEQTQHAQQTSQGRGGGAGNKRRWVHVAIRVPQQPRQQQQVCLQQGYGTS
jgi:hypothetical protein